MESTEIDEVSQLVVLAGPEDLLDACRKFVQAVPFPCLDVSRYISVLRSRKSESTTTAAVLCMYELEILLFYRSEPANMEEADQMFKSLSNLSQKKTSSVDPFVKLKYYDLLTDYQYFYSPDKELKLMDLVNRKLNSLSMVPHYNHGVVEDVQLKILIFYLMSGADFRKRNVQQYLTEEHILLRSHGEAIDSYKGAYVKRTLINPTLLNSFLTAVSYLSGLFHFVCSRYRMQLLENFLDVNISRLPRYFTSIRIERIYGLLLEGDHTIDVEDVVYRMIVANELPPGTSLDQLEGLVRFGEPPTEYDDFNNHVKSVCRLVDRISSEKT